MQYAPLRSLSGHRAAITSLAIGHGHMSTNIGVSAAQDKTCLVWDYRNGDLLHTFLLPLVPLCITLDPADRALFAGLEDGSVQLIDFFKNTPHSNGDNGYQGAHMPTQPSSSDRWQIPMDTPSRALCVSLSYDGTSVVTGHEDGRVICWDVGKGRYASKVCDLQAPVTNIQMIEPEGFPRTQIASTTTSNVVRPRYESSLGASSALGGLGVFPEKYAFLGLFSSPVPPPRLLTEKNVHDCLMDDFDAALEEPSFPSAILEEGMATFSDLGSRTANSEAEGDLQEEVNLLRAQLAHSRAAQLAHAERAVGLSIEV